MTKELIVTASVLMLTALHVGAQQVALVEWDPPVEGGPIDGYLVQRGTLSGGTVAEVDVGPATSMSILLDPGTWFFRVRAYNANGQSPPSDEAEVTIAEDPLPVNCVMSPWRFTSAGDWIIPCKPTASTTDPEDVGRLTRNERWTRTIVTPPANGGTPCGSLTQSRTGQQACVYVPPDPICVEMPLTVTVTSWTLPLAFTASEPIATVLPLLNATGRISHGAFTDLRGCVLTKSRW